MGALRIIAKATPANLLGVAVVVTFVAILVGMAVLG